MTPYSLKLVCSYFYKSDWLSRPRSKSDLYLQMDDVHRENCHLSVKESKSTTSDVTIMAMLGRVVNH